MNHVNVSFLRCPRAKFLPSKSKSVGGKIEGLCLDDVGDMGGGLLLLFSIRAACDEDDMDDDCDRDVAGGAFFIVVRDTSPS